MGDMFTIKNWGSMWHCDIPTLPMELSSSRQEACVDQLQLELARLHLERQTLAKFPHSDAFQRSQHW